MKTLAFYPLLFLTLIACNSKSTSVEKSGTTTQSKASQKKIVDLSHAYSDKTIYWVTSQEFKLDTVFKGQQIRAIIIQPIISVLQNMVGTHIDAPIHFAKNGQTVDEIPLEKLIGHAIKIDVSSKATNNP